MFFEDNLRVLMVALSAAKVAHVAAEQRSEDAFTESRAAASELRRTEEFLRKARNAVTDHVESAHPS